MNPAPTDPWDDFPPGGVHASPEFRKAMEQHATTLRLLEASAELLEEHALSAHEDLARDIRTHLAAMKAQP